MNYESHHHRWLDQPVDTSFPTMAPTTVEEAVIIVPWSVVWVTLLVSMFLGGFMHLIFIFLRRQHYQQDKYDLYEMRQFGLAHRTAAPWSGYASSSSTTTTTEEPHYRCFGWAQVAMALSDRETLRIVGMDAFMFLRFLRLSFRCSLFGTVLGCLILIPVYATGEAEGNDTEEFNSITLAKVGQGSPRLWASAIVWWLFVGFVLRELYLEWKETYAPYRYEFLAHGDVDTEQEYRYAVLIEHVPPHLRTNKALYHYLNRVFPNAIHQVHVCMNTVVLDGLVRKRTGFLHSLEQAIAMTKEYPNKPVPTVRQDGNMCGCGGNKTEAIPYYEREIAKLNEEIDGERAKLFSEATGGAVGRDDKSGIQNVLGMFQNMTNTIMLGTDGDDDNDDDDLKKKEAVKPQDPPAAVGVPVQEPSDDDETKVISDKMVSTAFVTFTSLRAKQAAIQCNIGGKANYLETTPAPDPKAIVWDNVTVSAGTQQRLAAIFGAVWTLGIVFWAIPATFVMGLANLNSLLEAFGLPQLNPDTFYYGLLAGLLPPLALQGFMVCLCIAIMSTAQFVIRKKSMPEKDAYTFSWYMLYQFANLWLILVGGSAFNQIDAMIKDPRSIATLLASAIPGASTFFLNMTILNTWVMSNFYLSNLAEFGQQILKSFIEPRFKTDRFIERKKPRELLWGFYLPPIIFIVLVSFVYIVIVPLLEPFAAALFGVYYVVWKHNCLHVYGNIGEGGGVIWEKIFRYIMVCLYTAEIIVCAYLGIKEGASQAIFCVVPLVATIVLHVRLTHSIIRPLQDLSMEVAADVDLKEGELSPISPADSEGAYAESVDRKLYGQPNLKPSLEERGPRPHLVKGDDAKNSVVVADAVAEKDEEVGGAKDDNRNEDGTKEETATDVA